MPLISLRQMLDHAAENDCAVPAFVAFGCAGQATKIRVLPLAALARRYARHDAPLRRAA